MTVKQNIAMVQCPSLKKKGTQTITISKDTRHLQTVCIKKIDKGTAWDIHKTSSVHTMTDYSSGVDAAVITIPPIGWHVQTDNTNHTLKRMGRKFKPVATQYEETIHDTTGSHLKEIQQAKSALANKIAAHAHDIKMKYKTCTGNVYVT